ncbi:MAG: type II secretion system F family protein [Propionivibrio sp.]|nr:type II secretion system F family protein [Propionivibrio sp.]
MAGINIQAIEAAYARFMFKHVNAGDRKRLWLKLSKLIGNGVQILQAIDSIKDRRIAAGGKSHPETIALEAWSAEIRNGARLSEAMQDWVGIEEMMLISAGEQSGTMQSAMESTVRVMESRKQISDALIGGLAYPFVLLLMAFAVLYLFGFKIVPAFTGVLHGGNWHGIAKAMINVSMFAKNWLWAVGAVFVGLVVLFFASLSRFDGPLRIKLDRYVPYSIYRVKQGSTWLIAIAALVEAGLRIETALEQLSSNASPWLRRRLQECLAGMRSGRNMGESLARSGYEFPDREIIDDLGVYSTLSGFDAALALLGREWLEESVAQIRIKMKVVFGFSILLVGGLVAFMVGGMMEMQLQLAQMLQQSMR